MRLFALVLAAAAATTSMGSSAQVQVHINVPGIVTVAPPAPRYEVVPAPRAGYVWAPGHWQWNENAYAWRRGYWERSRPDYAYAPGRWVRADGGWRWVEPGWKHSGKRRHGGRDFEDRHHRHDDHRHGRDDHRHGGYHCPPGQAKKGHC
ncbi:YXWGXW repeat-containing protein [Variovorax sp. KK3]|uniref:YXWGXW repeat-containing protein n=1 Tax=Variovorax sp. KK3 TaxID=1855728 RepID=UPI00097C7E76|nr:YXWGXW repeat-containing protein [Variovorax sp. KK3]